LPRYFFDYEDHTGITTDKVGSDLTDMAAIRQEASQSLSELADDILRTGLSRKFGYIVRDEEGAVVLEASVVFSVKVRPPIASG
jgi:hypothetical protein